jgi:hypothetical protein
MPNADDLFKDENLQAKDFLEKLRPEDLAAADKDALRNILKQQWDGLQDESMDLDARPSKNGKQIGGMRSND